MDTIKIEKKNTLMVAHRGVSGLEKENTLAAFIAAGNRSYYGVETDVHRTADGKYVVIHDSDTAGVSPLHVEIEKSAYDTIRGVMLNDIDGTSGRTDLRVPSLEEYIKVCKRYGKYCILELKGAHADEDITNIIGIINEQDYLDHVIFISFSLQNLINLRKQLPDQPAQWLTGDWKEEYKSYLVDNNLDLDIWYGSLTEETYAWLRSLGKKVNVWACDDPAAAAKYVEMGVDYITSNILE